jgi:hypothetical protein
MKVSAFSQDTSRVQSFLKLYMIYSKIWKFFNIILHQINPNSPDFGTVLKITFDEKSFMFHGENHRDRKSLLDELFIWTHVIMIQLENHKTVSCVHLNLSSKLALESRLRTHHSCKSVDLNSGSVILYPYSTFTIESSTPTLRINLNERTISVYHIFWG